MDRLSDSLYSLGNAFQDPFWGQTEKLARSLYVPLNPDENLQHDSKAIEILERTFWVAMTPLALITLSFALIGQGCKILSSLISSKSYVTFEAKQSKIVSELKLLTFNVCGLPGCLPFFHGGIDPMRYRISEFVEIVKKKKPNVICLQEIAGAQSDILARMLRCRGYTVYNNIGKTALNLDTAMLFATKEKPLSVEYHSFNIKGQQKGVERGFFIAKLKNAIIITTHLQPGDEKSDKMVRNKMLKAIQQRAQKINKFTSNNSRKLPIFFAGDFNISKKGDGSICEFTDSVLNQFNDNENLKFYPYSLQFGLDETYTDEIFIRRFRKEQKATFTTLDFVGILSDVQLAKFYIFYLPKPVPCPVYGYQRVGAEGIIENPFSDHHGLFFKIQLT